MSNDLKNIVEAVLLVSDTPLVVTRIQSLFDHDLQPSIDEIKKVIAELQQECEQRGIELCKIGNGYRYQSRTQYAHWIQKLCETRPPKMSRAMLETLAIIAYRQPVTRGDIESIRGVGVRTDIMQRLLERGWVKEVGVRDLPGHPALFATTPEFLSWFGLESLKDLPELSPPRSLDEIANDIGTPLSPEVSATLQPQMSNVVPMDDVEVSASDTTENHPEQLAAPPF